MIGQMPTQGDMKTVTDNLQYLHEKTDMGLSFCTRTDRYVNTIPSVVHLPLTSMDLDDLPPTGRPLEGGCWSLI